MMFGFLILFWPPLIFKSVVIALGWNVNGFQFIAHSNSRCRNVLTCSYSFAGWPRRLAGDWLVADEFGRVDAVGMTRSGVKAVDPGLEREDVAGPVVIDAEPAVSGVSENADIHISQPFFRRPHRSSDKVRSGAHEVGIFSLEAPQRWCQIVFVVWERLATAWGRP